MRRRALHGIVWAVISTCNGLPHLGGQALHNSVSSAPKDIKGADGPSLNHQQVEISSDGEAQGTFAADGSIQLGNKAQAIFGADGHIELSNKTDGFVEPSTKDKNDSDGKAHASPQHEEKARNKFFFRVYHKPATNSSESMVEQDAEDSDEAALSAKLESEVSGKVGWEESVRARACVDMETPLTDMVNTDLGRHHVSQLMSHDVACEGLKLMTRFRVNSGDSATKMKVDFKCCQFSDSLGTCTDESTAADSSELVSSNHGDLRTLATATLGVDCPKANTGLMSWKMRNDDSTKSGEKIAIDYKCCEVSQDASFGDKCTDHDTASASETDRIQGLFAHDAECQFGFAMQKWHMVHDDSKFHLQYTCCPIGTQVQLGKEGHCDWVGDPHVGPTDGGVAHIMTEDYGFYWMVKGDYMEAQAYYQSISKGGKMFTKGSAFGGKFLLGNKLIIKHATQALEPGEDGTVKSYGSVKDNVCKTGTRTIDCATSVCWNGVCDDSLPLHKTFMDGRVSVDKTKTGYGSFVRVSMPLDSVYESKEHDRYSNNVFYMHQPGSGQVEGQCGNFDGNRDYEKDIGEKDGNFIPEGSTVNMFLTDHTGAERYKDGVKFDLADCPDRAIAENICDSKFAGQGNVTLTYKEICVYDMCATMDDTTTAEQLDLVNADLQAGLTAKVSVDLALPRKYGLAALAGKAEAELWMACDGIGMKTAKPRSAGEARAIMETMSQEQTPGNVVLIGVKKNSGGEWTWLKDEAADAEELVCGVDKLWARHQLKSSKSHACLNLTGKESGMWFGCEPTDATQLACEEDKKYGVLSQAGPITARNACGEGKQLAMPKSQRERTRLSQAIVGQTLAFIGGSYGVARGWHWDDGAQLCAPGIWTDGQPLPIDNNTEGQHFMCVTPATGEAAPCSGTDPREVVCETKYPDRQCPLTNQNMDLDFKALLTKPAKRSTYMDFCYYLAPEETSCSEFCLSVAEHFVCDEPGLKVLATTPIACQMVVSGLGLDDTKTSRSEGSAPVGCTYTEREAGAVVERDVDVSGPAQMPKVIPPLCRDKPPPGQHRVCSCKKSDMVFPDGYAVTPGDDLNLVGRMGDLPFSMLVKSATDNTDILKFEADPTKQVIKRSYFYQGQWREGEDQSSWPFDGVNKGDPYIVDLVSLAKTWEVWVMGLHLPSLDFPREVSVPVPDSIEVNGVTGEHVSLIVRPAVGAHIPTSLYSQNGCKRHPFSVKGGTVSFFFEMLPFKTELIQCIRCEETDFRHGTHVYLQKNTLVFTVKGAVPHKQEFQFPFQAGSIHYDVAILYLKEAKKVELYLNRERVQAFDYTTAVDLDLGPGDIGCSNGQFHMYEGSITDFHITTEDTSWRKARERCTAVKCRQPAFRALINAYDEFCAGPYCTDSDADHNTCCDSMPKCNPGKTCPTASSYNASAGAEFCHDKDCNGTPVSVCCVPLASCDDFNCPAGKLKRINSIDRLCSHEECLPPDEDKCCGEFKKCYSYTCPTNWELNLSARHQPCASEECGSNDTNTCCEEKGNCSVFTGCPQGNILIASPETVRCDDNNCTASLASIQKCCTDAGNCRDYACPTGLVNRCEEGVLAPPAQCTMFCDTGKCEPSKEHNTKCCKGRALCNTITCDAGSVEHPSANITHCRDIQCEAVDQKTCCGHVGMCSEFVCPPEMRRLENASQIPCDDQDCWATNYTKCCGLDGMCSTHECEPTYTLKPSASIERCEDFVCAAADHVKCCDRAALCTSQVCPPVQVERDNASQTYCKGLNCEPEEYDLCCIDRGRCNTTTCPMTYTHRHNAEILRCDDAECVDTDFTGCCTTFAHCLAFSCPDGYVHRDDAPHKVCPGLKCIDTDRDHCCKQVQSCASYNCPTRYDLKTGGEFLYCKGAECDHGDLHTCCHTEGWCSEFKCDFENGWLHKPAAHEIPCDDKECKETPDEKCCAAAGMCNSYKCPALLVVRKNAAEISCESYLCNIRDNITCCEPALSCLEHQCDAGTTKRHNAAERVCNNISCAGTDNNNCCVPDGHCKSFDCPKDMLHRQDEDLLCDDENCTDTLFTTCCSSKKKCNTYDCPKGFVHVDGADALDCKETTGCTNADRDRCCDENQWCTGYNCPTGLVIKNQHAKIMCEGASCVVDERLTCCTREGTCDAFECPPDMVHRHNAGDLFCADMLCKETDFNLCCVEQGHCQSMKCPEMYVHGRDSDTTFCTDWICHEADTEACCDLRARCNADICPEDKRLRYDRVEELCKSNTCDSKEDIGTCCTEMDKCTTMVCPAGYSHRHNANDLFKTNDTSYHKCCAEDDFCHTYSCPEGFVHEANADVLECQGFVCDDTDRDTCCKHKAWCNTYDCPGDGILILHAAGLLCETDECSIADNTTCCNHKGNCLMKDCPASHLHKENASSIPCSDKQCLDTDVDTCCKRKAECLSDESLCNETLGVVQKDSTEPLYCAGFMCVPADAALCCKGVAHCNTYEPPKGYLLKHNASKYKCLGPVCSDRDLHTCAGEPGMCSMFPCPDTFFTKAHARHLPCADFDCNATDFENCCASAASCESLHCEEHWVHQAHSQTLPCSNETCTEEDHSICCQKAPTCNTYLCLNNSDSRPNASDIFCHNQQQVEMTTCDVEDQTLCCVTDGMCSSFPCPLNYLHRHDAHNVSCVDSNCTNTSFEICCAETGVCPTYTCAGKFIHKELSDEIHCRDELCTDADKYLCCDHTASCELYQCPEDMEPKPNEHLHKCEGVTCIEHVDTPNCCRSASGGVVTPGPSGTDDVVTPGPSGTDDVNITGGEGNTSWEDGACRGNVGGLGCMPARNLELSMLVLTGFIALVPTALRGFIG